MKKEKPLALVIFCMFLLLLLIIVPPVFRKYIPKKEEVKLNYEEKHLDILMCNKTFSDNIHTGVSRSKYINGKLITNTIIFDMIDTNLETNGAVTPSNDMMNNTEQPVEKNQDIMLIHPFEEEYQALTNMVNANVKIEENKTTIVIDEEIANQNLNTDGINNYFQSIDLQKKFYEELGYVCDVIKS